jgi:hypothetical protein
MMLFLVEFGQSQINKKEKIKKNLINYKDHEIKIFIISIIGYHFK